jgi:hypothetical protein
MGASFAKIFELCFSFEAIEAGDAKYKASRAVGMSLKSADIESGGVSDTVTWSNTQLVNRNRHKNNSLELYTPKPPEMELYMPKPPEVELSNSTISIKIPNSTIVIGQLEETPAPAPPSPPTDPRTQIVQVSKTPDNRYLYDTDPEDFDYGVIVQDSTSDESDDSFEVV